MAQKHIKAIIQLRRATEEQWIKANPVLFNGEPALSTDKNKIKIGNGTSKWSELEYTNNFNDVIIDCGTSTTNI